MKEGKWTPERIREARHANGLSQTEMALKLGCRMQTVSEWETGLYAPQNAYRRLLTALFGKPKK